MIRDMPKATENRNNRLNNPVPILSAKEISQRGCMICGGKLILVGTTVNFPINIGKFKCYNCDMILSEKIQ